jgi:hypothetical protein
MLPSLTDVPRMKKNCREKWSKNARLSARELPNRKSYDDKNKRSSRKQNACEKENVWQPLKIPRSLHKDKRSKNGD